MFKSMTAFGRGKKILDGKEISVEIKSVNSKALDCSVKLPREYSYIEEYIRPRLAEFGISRGKIDITIGMLASESKGVTVKLDEAYAESYINALRELAQKFGLADDISVMQVAANRDIFIVGEGESEDDTAKTVENVLSVLDEALQIYDGARSREGEALMNDIRQKLDGISEHVNAIEQISLTDIASYGKRLEEKLRRVLDEYSVKADEQRILTECAIFADRVAIDEEIVRMRTHISALHALTQQDQPVGRRFEFLLQELNREINTTGSKCSNTDIAALVVSVKAEIEKIREQIQNVE